MKIKTVGIAGSLCRMGTTTQAIQLVKYLKLMGFRVAYVEMNKSQYIENLSERFPVEEKRDCVLFEGVELYKQEKIAVANNKDYEYLIKDYGFLNSPELALSYNEQNIRILTCGQKPNELVALENAVRALELQGVKYIFSFVPKKYRAWVLEQMDDCADVTFFVEHVIDPYEYLSSANNVCKAILEL